ncbi:hypothetical protein QQF64_009610 [Cirrhinus molitorella]|uniref:Uncharacterized protein n=1 Tax=Cirrhinus molitorella TaxID=172907 RepID=A0ABR3M1Q1_9TELE
MPKVNVVVERHTFRKRVQAPHENIQQYFAALHALAANCDFANKVNAMIHDQLLEHLQSDDIRQRLLLKPDLTLQKAIALTIQLEAAAEHAKRMTAAASARGSDKHLANSAQCPAAKLHCKQERTFCASVPFSLSCSVSILPLHTYKRYFSDTELSTPAIRLDTYTQKCIPVLGCLQAQAVLSNASAAATFYIVDKGTALLGMDLISALKLQIKARASVSAELDRLQIKETQDELELSFMCQRVLQECVAVHGNDTEEFSSGHPPS